MSHKFDFILKASLEETPSIIKKKIEFILKVPLEETLFIIPQILIYIIGAFSRNTFHNFTNFKLYYMSFKFDFILKVSLQKIPFTIPKKLNLYRRCVFKRHISQFNKI